MLLPHGRELLEVLPLAELYTTYQYHARLQVFAEKGRECVVCGRVGTLLVLSRETDSYKESRKRKSIGRVHVDLFTDDFVLMTVDHIVPKKVAREFGWGKLATESLDNKQPMCDPCNNSKGCRPISNEQLTLNRKNAKPRLVSVEVLRGLVDNIHRLNGDDAWLGKQDSNLPVTGQSRAPYH